MCPAVKIASFIREDLNVQQGLYCYGVPIWRCLVVGCFRSEYNLRMSSNPEIIPLFPLTPMFPCFLRNMYLKFYQVSSGKIINLMDWSIVWGEKAEPTRTA